jgi:hypothetical protein
VVASARRRETEPTGLDAGPRQLAHGRDVGVGGGLAGGAALAHHVQPNSGVRHLHGDVGVEVAVSEGVEELGEGLPRPRQTLVQRAAGDVLDALHELDQAVVVGRAHRGEPDAAVAGHDGRDAVPGRRDEAVVPGRLAVVVAVDVDEAGRHEQAVGVHLSPSPTRHTSDVGDEPAGDGDVGGPGVGPGPVDDRAAPEHEVMFGHGADRSPRR